MSSSSSSSSSSSEETQPVIGGSAISLYSQTPPPTPRRSSFRGRHLGLGNEAPSVEVWAPQFKEDDIPNASEIWAGFYPCLDGSLQKSEVAEEMFKAARKVEPCVFQKRAFEALYDVVQTPFEFATWEVIFAFIKELKADIRERGVCLDLTLTEVWELAGVSVTMDPSWLDRVASTGVHMKTRMYRIELRQLGDMFLHRHQHMITAFQNTIPESVVLNRQAVDAKLMHCSQNLNPPQVAPTAPVLRPEQMQLDRSPSPIQDAIDRRKPRKQSGSDLVYVTALFPLAALWMCSPFGVVVGTAFAVSSVWKVKRLTQRTCDLAVKAMIIVNERSNAVAERALGAVKEVTDKTTLAVKEAGDNAANSLRQAAAELGNKVQTVAADTTESVKRVANANVASMVMGKVVGAIDWSLVMAAIGILGFIASYVMRKPSRIRNMEAVRKHVRKHDGQESLSGQLTTLLEPVLMDKHEYSTIRSATDVLSTMFLIPLLFTKGPKFAFQMGQTISSSVRMIMSTWQIISLMRGWFSDEESPVDVVEANMATIVERIEVRTDPVLAAQEETQILAALVIDPHSTTLKEDLAKIRAAKAAPPVHIDKENVFWKWAQENRALAASFVVGVVALFAGSAYLMYQKRRKTVSTHVFRVGERIVYINDNGESLESPVGRVRVYQKILQDLFPTASFGVSCGRQEGKKKFYVTKSKKGRWVVYDEKGKFIDYIDAFDNTDDELIFQDRDDMNDVLQYMHGNNMDLGDDIGYDGEDFSDWMRETENIGDSHRVRMLGTDWRANAPESAPPAIPSWPPRKNSVAPVPPSWPPKKWAPAVPALPPKSSSPVAPPTPLPYAPIASASSAAAPLSAGQIKAVAEKKIAPPATNLPAEKKVAAPAFGKVPVQHYWLNRKMTSDCSFGGKCDVDNCQFVHPKEDRCFKPWCGCPQPHPFEFKARCDKPGCDQKCGRFHRKDKVAVQRVAAPPESLHGMQPVADSKLAKTIARLEVDVSDKLTMQGQCFTMANRVWTAKHCLSGGSHPSNVTYRDDTKMSVQSGKWVGCDGFDIGYTPLCITDRPSLSVGDAPEVGQPVHIRVFDYTKSEWVTWTGTVKNVDSTFLHYDIPTDEGYSGAAVLNQKGHVVAMHTNGAAVRNGPNQGLRITPSLVAFLTKSKN